MENAEYISFETPFREAARPLMQQLRDALTARGLGPFTEIEVVDQDIARGLGFNCSADPEQFVDLMLTDNDTHGDEGVGLILTCSTYASGQVWAPGNYTDEFALTHPDQVVERLSMQFDPAEIADRVASEWARQADSHKAATAMRGA